MDVTSDTIVAEEDAGLAAGSGRLEVNLPQFHGPLDLLLHKRLGGSGNARKLAHIEGHPIGLERVNQASRGLQNVYTGGKRVARRMRGSG